MKKLIQGLILSTLAFSPLAFADTSPWNDHAGSLYVELNAGTNAYYLGVFSSEGTTSGAGVLGGGFSTAIGYDFTKVFALEAGFMQNYLSYNHEQKYYEHTNVPYISTRFNVPITDRLDFIGKLGMMALNAEDETMILPYTGIGLSYAVTPKVAIEAQYQGAIYGIAGAGLMSLGVSYHFD